MTPAETIAAAEVMRRKGENPELQVEYMMRGFSAPWKTVDEVEPCWNWWLSDYRIVEPKPKRIEGWAVVFECIGKGYPIFITMPIWPPRAPPNYARCIRLSHFASSNSWRSNEQIHRRLFYSEV